MQHNNRAGDERSMSVHGGQLMGKNEGDPPVEGPILVVEDDHEIQRMIQWLLEDEGLPVETAGDGAEALRRVRERRPALVVLDLNLPLLDGDEVAAALRAVYGDSVPIVVVSIDSSASEKARRVKAIEHLRKPFDITDLVDAVRHGLRAA